MRTAAIARVTDKESEANQVNVLTVLRQAGLGGVQGTCIRLSIVHISPGPRR